MFGISFKFGNAWIDAFEAHGYDSSTARTARTHGALEGDFYREMLELWKREDSRHRISASYFLGRHWDEIEPSCDEPGQRPDERILAATWKTVAAYFDDHPSDFFTSALTDFYGAVPLDVPPPAVLEEWRAQPAGTDAEDFVRHIWFEAPLRVIALDARLRNAMDGGP